MILAINTSHGICSVAISNNGVIVAEKNNLEHTKQAELLLSIIGELLHENGLAYKDVNALAADIGPGSFTGIRIGLAAARGIALAANIPLIGVTGFEALVHTARLNESHENILVVMDAKRGQIYAQLFTANKITQPQMLEYSEIVHLAKSHHHITLIGDGGGLIEPFLAAENINYSVLENLTLPDAAMVALCASEKIRTGQQGNAAPLYIRPPDAKLPQDRKVER